MTEERDIALEQEEVLRRQHCDFAQGYYYARPMPESQYREFIQKQQLMSSL